MNRTAKMSSAKWRIINYHENINSFCSIGFRRTKLLLNSDKKTDIVVYALRLALDIEIWNIKAKKNKKTEKYYYKKKHSGIRELIKISKEQGWTYGYHHVNDMSVSEIKHVIYFEIPGCDQLSYHITFREKELKEIPEYLAEWDGLGCSIFSKLEKAITERYPEELEKKVREVNKLKEKFPEKFKTKWSDEPDYIFDRESNDNNLDEILRVLKDPENQTKFIMCRYDKSGMFAKVAMKKKFNIVMTLDGRPVTFDYVDRLKDLFSHKYRQREFALIRVDCIYCQENPELLSKEEIEVIWNISGLKENNSEIIKDKIKELQNKEDFGEKLILCVKNSKGIIFLGGENFNPLTYSDGNLKIFNLKPRVKVKACHALRIKRINFC